MPAGTRGLVAGAGVSLILAAGSGTAIVMDRLDAVPPGAVARVGDVIITERELDERAKMMAALSGQPAAADRTLLAKDAVINQVLQDAAAENSIVIADKTVDDKLTELLEKSFPQGRDQFMAAMNQAGVSEAAVRSGIRQTMLTGRLFEQITKDVEPPTDQDVAQTYEQRKADLTIPEQRHVRNIAVASEEQARQVRARLDRGEDFAVVAREMSIDTETKDKGGDLGTATRKEIPTQAFGDAVFAAAPQSVFGPIQTNPQVWSVGQVLEVVPPNLPPLAAVRDQVRAQLFNIRKINRFNAWLAERLKSADVRYADGYRPADPTGLPSSPADPTLGGEPR